MAVDTATKRLSMMAFGQAWWDTLPVADGSFDYSDRLHLLGLYSLRPTAKGAIAGNIRVYPRITGSVTALPRITGRIRVRPKTTGGEGVHTA